MENSPLIPKSVRSFTFTESESSGTSTVSTISTESFTLAELDHYGPSKRRLSENRLQVRLKLSGRAESFTGGYKLNDKTASPSII